MNIFQQVWAWLTDPANWTTTFGTPGIPQRLAEHLQYTVVAVAIAALIAVPLGAYIGHTNRGVTVVVGLVNSFRALPELGLLILLVLSMGVLLAVEALTIALVLVAVPPLLAGTYAGVRNVDRSVVDAARGMGMREWDVLRKVELPNALPLVFGALRTATLQVIATASIAAFVSLGGLGRYVIDGLAFREFEQMAGGAVLIALLAVAVELALTGVQWLVVSPGLRTRTK
ncbi:MULTISPECIES: ABC transporter permease [Actinokineospora]|uniref:ABC transporter permease n=1 Tax=Actinokineospora fastidiosa TaxID=1816 RepID=A0A918GAR5_9PSEU|nr:MULTISPECIES: ABC transporter permease [Actinokineospora]UVS81690.1 Glycine betaine/carnitine/choline transport system permease protein OpuCB [Actinokineospora sp. UTMC 2448]GGS25935.1 ABC transporter permease [Actinokineospora fastidiosa]